MYLYEIKIRYKYYDSSVNKTSVKKQEYLIYKSLLAYCRNKYILRYGFNKKPILVDLVQI